MAEKISKIHWSEVDLKQEGFEITPTLINQALQTYWKKPGDARQTKEYLNFDSERDGWCEGALIGCHLDYSGIKNIHFAPANSKLNKPLCHIDIVLRQKSTGERLLSLEGKSISFGRTGWFAPACIRLLLDAKDHIEVFLFGAGELAKAVIKALNADEHCKIKRIRVLSRGPSNKVLVNEFQPMMKFILEAVTDHYHLSEADLVITAASSSFPLFAAKELASHAVTLSLSKDDMPSDYFDSLLDNGGTIICDDMKAMEKRNLNALALYFSRRGGKLSEAGSSAGIKNYADVIRNEATMKAIVDKGGPAHFTTVGLGSMDIAVAARIYEGLSAKYV
ncbi:hypothetical protein L7F22_034103 [Adiantum nelumboides]|nr:hypothetical protein [Adiantum nelumboides]